MSPESPLPSPRRIIASNLPIKDSDAAAQQTEPAVEVLVDTLTPEAIPGTPLRRARIATIGHGPTSNEGSGREMPLDHVPGLGIVMPGGVNMYYLDLEPKSDGTMHRTTSTDYLVVVSGTLSLMTPPKAFQGKDYGEPVKTLCRPGEVVVQRGMMHA
ncbi:hypothetical protein F5Y15DRAFT_420585 [Xylariaceae sp. FL0016]|nr:hypothetical protein F5Y15DRAFT_420585 [Xylariaceae sp. FL0016]